MTKGGLFTRAWMLMKAELWHQQEQVERREGLWGSEGCKGQGGTSGGRGSKSGKSRAQEHWKFAACSHVGCAQL